MISLETGKIYQFIRGVRVKSCEDINNVVLTTWGEHEFMMVGFTFIYLGKSITKVEYIGQGMDEVISYYLILVNEKLYWFYVSANEADIDCFVRECTVSE